jgi:sucrose-6-phosphate hydrolase SacC (GH32 family)
MRSIAITVTGIFVGLAACGAAARQTVEPPAQRDITLQRRYLHLPVVNGAAERVVRFLVDGKAIREFKIELADGDPDFYVSSDLSAFAGKSMSIEIDHAPSANVLDGIVQADEIPGAKELYQEKYRPQFHFSPRSGWVGDPNGLVFYKGEYHLFFQYNPYAVKWGNMSWGHAVSKDLVHWKELPITLFPPTLGDHPYSGSAVVDRENTAGFKIGAEDPIVIVFPSTRRGICLAYSTDGGQTFAEYASNPLQKNLGGDPRVFWHEATRRWIMITCKILKPSKETPPGRPGWLEKTLCGFEFYSSNNLKDWEHHSTMDDCWECPDLFELQVDGKPDLSKWVLMPNHTPSLSGGGKYAGGRYFFGAFDGQRFTPESERLLFNFGNAYAAAQSYNNIPAADGRRINVGCAFGTRMPGMPFGQMMNFPAELTLRTTEDGLRLFAWPIKEIETLYADTRKMDGLALTTEGTVLPGIAGDLFDIAAEFAIGAQTEDVGLKIRGVPVAFDAKASQLVCGDRIAPLKPVDGRIRLRLLVDRVSIEIFANDGRVYMPMAIIPKDEDRSIAVFAKGAGTSVTALTVRTLKSAWEQ